MNDAPKRRQTPTLAANLNCNVAACLLVAEAAQCLDGEYSPLDCHNDIPQAVAWLVGFYQGKAEMEHMGSPMRLALEDLTAMLRFLKGDA